MERAGRGRLAFHEIATRFAGLFVPRPSAWPWSRRLAVKSIFARPFIDLVLMSFGSKSILTGQR